ncbi:MAG TPA: amino acid permease [Candidatus Thermoplasmatota archaeon]|nr:amino acid permease [Candidatus Thermoplasmatota archaeon]
MNAPRRELRRDLGLAAAVSVIVGSMIGVGIFLGPRVVAQQLPTPGLMLAAWAAGGVFVLCGAMTYAEMATLFPRSGGSYNFIKAAFGPFPAFLSGWSGVAIGKAANVSALAVGFGQVGSVLLSALVGVTLTPAGQLVAAAALILALALVNILGVRHGGRLSIVASTVKVGALAGLILAGLVVLAPRYGTLASADIPAPSGLPLLSAFGLALIPIFFAYDGWENSTQVADEVRDPKKNVPRSLILGTLLVLAIYVLANLVYLLAVGPGTVGASTFAAGETADEIFGPGANVVVSVAILVSIVGTVNNIVLTGPRIAFAMAKDGLVPDGLSKLTRFATPGRAILLQSAISLALVMLPPVGGAPLFDTLLTYIIVDSFVFYALATGAIFVLRRTMRDAPRAYRVPLYPIVPGIFVVGSILFVINAFVRTPAEAAVGILIVLAGTPIYLYSRRARRAKKLDGVTYSWAETR